MTTTRTINLQSLHNPVNYRGVSPETRTAIINAIGIDIEGLCKQQGGKYTEEELIRGLRYLLSSHAHLRRYMETSPDYCFHSDPFFVPNGTDWLLLSLAVSSTMNHHHHHGGSNVDCCSPNGLCSSDSNSNDKDNGLGFLVGILVGIVVAAACLCCIGACVSTGSMINNNETTLAKSIKGLANTLSFVVPFGLAFYGFMHVFNPGQDYYYLYVTSASFLVGATCALITSLLNLISCFDKDQAALANPPSGELLAELATIKRLLEGEYTRPGDDQKACEAFIKDVVKYYIQTIAKSPDKDASNEKTALLSKTGMFAQPVAQTTAAYPQLEGSIAPAL